MSHVMADEQSSRLKHFVWEELDENFLIVVIFRSGRRYVVQRHFEQQLLNTKSSHIQTKWRRCLLDVVGRSLAPIFITYAEVELMHDIFSWHMNYAKNHIKLRENVDYLIDFEDLIDSSGSLVSSDKLTSSPCASSLIQPVTTLDAARKNIELWKSLQETIEPARPDLTVVKQTNRTKTPISTSTQSSDPSSSTGWLQLDSKAVPFIKKQCDRLLPVDYLLKQHIISSSEDFSLRSHYIPVEPDDVHLFNTLICQSSFSSNHLLTTQSLLITLDHFIFRSKRLFFIRFLSSSTIVNAIDYHQIMSSHGGLLTLLTPRRQRLPFLYINRVKYIPQLTHLTFGPISTFCMASPSELGYLRLVSLYDYLSSDENLENLTALSSTNNLTLIPITSSDEQKIETVISFHDFHYHEYQRRTQQQRNLRIDGYDHQLASGWWQPPVSSSKRKRPLSHFTLQPPIFF